MRLIRVVGANDTPTAEDMEIAEESLKGLLNSLDADLLNIHTIHPHRFLLTAGAEKYTLGPAVHNGAVTGANWATVRPMRVEKAIILQNADIEYPIEPSRAVTYVSGVYPFLFEDDISVNTRPNDGFFVPLFEDNLSLDNALISGTLETSISYVDFNSFGDELSIDMALQSGTLEITFNQVDYSLEDEISIDMSLQSGTLAVTISYVDYDYFGDNLSVNSTLISGTLV
jgi:hypothetical protein